MLVDDLMEEYADDQAITDEFFEATHKPRLEALERELWDMRRKDW
jgi:hypothetical protein